jgi:hypothetical protein
MDHPTKKNIRTPDDKAPKKGKKTPKQQKSQLHKIIEKGQINVVKYIKLANRFERQKLGRRQTEQRKDPEKLAKVEAEIVACKVCCALFLSHTDYAHGKKKTDSNLRHLTQTTSRSDTFERPSPKYDRYTVTPNYQNSFA